MECFAGQLVAAVVDGFAGCCTVILGYVAAARADVANAVDRFVVGAAQLVAEDSRPGIERIHESV